VQHLQVSSQQPGVEDVGHLESARGRRKTAGVKVSEQCFRLVAQALQHSFHQLAGSPRGRSRLGVKSQESTHDHEQFGPVE
jgi:hypothetical protein